jgi:hypothetical protein
MLTRLHRLPIAAFLLSLPPVLAGGCGDVDTGGEAVLAELVFDPPTGGDIAADGGWTVTLSTAQVLVGPVFLLDASPLASVWSLFSSPALAHVPASGGQTVGEWIGQVSVDLLSGDEVVLGALAGQTGRALSAEVQLLAPGTIGEAALQGASDASIVLEGTATRGAESVPFRFTAAPEGASVFSVQNIATDFAMQTGLVISVSFDLAALFSNVDFGELVADGSGATDPVELTELTAAGASLRAGMGSRFVWQVSVEAGP